MSPCSFVWKNDLEQLIADRSLERLLAIVPDATLFTTAEWLGCATASLPPDRHLHLLCARSGGNLIAFLPLTRGREVIHNVPVISLRFLGDPLADRIALPIDPQYQALLPAIFDQLLLHAPFPWDVLVLGELFPDAPLREVIEKWSVANRTAIHWQHTSCTPVLPLSCRNAAELRSTYPKSLAIRLRRSRKKLEAAGPVEFRRLLPTPEEAADILPRLQELENASWKGAQGVGIFSTPESCAFFRRLAPVLAAKRRLDLGLLLQDGRLISYRFGFRFRNIFLDYNLAFHPDWAAMAPGRILLEEMIASSADLGLRAVDASRSGLFHAHQLQEWTEEKIDHFQLWIFHRTVRGHILNLLHTRIRPALKKVVTRETGRC